MTEKHASRQGTNTWAALRYTEGGPKKKKLCLMIRGEGGFRKDGGVNIAFAKRVSAQGINTRGKGKYSHRKN